MNLQCDGWWEQNYLGRQEMQPLELSFRDGEISGSGEDVVGPFTLQGTLQNGNVSINKQYHGQHAALYVGQFDGEGTMQGTWYIGEMTGPWLIRIGRPKGDEQSLNIKQVRSV